MKMLALSILKLGLLTITTAGILEEYHFYQSYGEFIEDQSGNGNWAVQGDDHASDARNMIFVEDRGVYGDGNDRFVKGPVNSHPQSTAGVNLGQFWTIAWLIKASTADKVTWFSKAQYHSRIQLAFSVEQEKIEFFSKPYNQGGTTHLWSKNSDWHEKHRWHWHSVTMLAYSWDTSYPYSCWRDFKYFVDNHQDIATTVWASFCQDNAGFGDGCPDHNHFYGAIGSDQYAEIYASSRQNFNGFIHTCIVKDQTDNNLSSRIASTPTPSSCADILELNNCSTRCNCGSDPCYSTKDQCVLCTHCEFGSCTWDYATETATCVANSCHQSCTACDTFDDIDECTACPANASLTSPPTSSCACDDFFYDSDTGAPLVCIDCHSSCRTCTGGTEFLCTGCAANANVNPVNGAWGCNSGFYDDNILDPVDCIACHSAWEEWDGELATNCLTCVANAEVVASGTCECSLGYDDSDPGDAVSCASWHPRWAGCDGPNPTDCTSCTADASVDGTGTCLWDPGYQDQDPSDPVDWVPCHDSCVTCNGAGANACQSCVIYASLDGNSCKCDDGFYDSDTGDAIVCTLCSLWCLTCKDGTPQGWLSWHTVNEVIQHAAGNSECVCAPGFYDDNPTDPNVCQSCDPACIQCTGPTNSDCPAWNTNYYMQPPTATSNHCMSSCPYGYMGNDTTQQCDIWHANCATCSGTLHNNWLTCKDSNAVTGLLSGSAWFWDRRFYNSAPGANDVTCTAWYIDCGYCSGPNQTDCLSCSDNNAFVNSGGTCVCNGHYYDSNTGSPPLTCSPCYASCSSCNDASSNQCRGCVGPNASLDVTPTGTCLCDVRYYDANNGTPPTNWQSCSIRCATCLNANATSCTSWVDPYASPTITGECACNEGYYDAIGAAGQLSCQPCHNYWKHCTSVASHHCTDWYDVNASPALTNPGYCLCNPGFYDLRAGVEPLDCALCYTDWSSCTSPANTDWLGCHDNNANAAGGICVCNDVYYDVNNGVAPLTCSPWFANCKTCSDGGTTSCITCDDADAEIVTPGICTCKTGFYDLNGGTAALDWASCYLDWSTCTNSAQTQCLSCISVNAVLTATPGSWYCPDAFYDASSATDPMDCVGCFSDWKTCSSPANDDCISCFDSNALAVAGICECLDGFFDSNQGTGSLNCVSWFVDCSDCNSTASNDWTDCHDTNAEPNILPAGTCVWKATYFDQTYGTGLLQCVSCSANCNTCLDAGQNSWFSWVDPNASTNLAANVAGEWICNTGFFNSGSAANLDCRPWHQNWATCNNSNLATEWETCQHPDAFITLPTPGACECNQYFYDANDPNPPLLCLPCFMDCDTCQDTTNTGWNSCIDNNAELATDPGECLWKTGFYDDSAAGSPLTCRACYTDWTTCVGLGVSLWTGCYDAQATPDNNPGTCVCIDNYYDINDGTGNQQSWAQWALNWKTWLDSSASNCSSWMDANAVTSPLGLGTWVCDRGYYDLNYPFQPIICAACFVDCATWVDANSGSWKTCMDANAFNDTGVCLCPSRFYNANFGSPISWQPCFDDCEECLSGSNNACMKCRDSNAATVGPGACECETGFYDSNGGSPIVCSPWATECSTCTGHAISDCVTWSFTYYLQPEPDQTTCLQTCPEGTYPNDLTRTCSIWHESCANWDESLETNWLSCFEKANLSDGACVCQTGTVASPSSADCQPCHESCATWTGVGSTECETCAVAYSMTPTGTCITCPSGQYFNIDTCSECYEDCSTCDAYPTCLSCKSSALVPSDTGQCIAAPWINGTFGQSGNCQNCHATWTQCTNYNICQEWVENAEIDASGDWTCIPPYTEEGASCIVDTVGPIPSLSVTSDNDVVLSFDEQLLEPLSSDEVSVVITGSRSGGYDFSWELTQIDDTNYEISIQFDHSDIPADTRVTVELNGSLLDAAENSIAVTTLNGSMNAVEEEEEETDPVVAEQEEQAQALSEATEGTSQASMSASVAASAATGDFGAAWNMLNTLQVLAFIPMMKTPLPLPLRATLISFLEFEIIPNLFEFMISEDETEETEPYTEAKEFGFETTVFIMNAGEMITQTLVFLCFMPIALLLQHVKNHHIAGYFHDVVKSYHWAFFIRAWIEIFLEVVIAAFLQVLYPSFDNTLHVANTILGYIFFVGLLSTPFVVWAFMIRRIDKIQNSEEKMFAKTYGSLFNEFKNDKGTMSSLFYVWFFTRRILYVANLIFLREWVGLQLSLNLLHCVITIAFLGLYNPYIGKYTSFVTLYSEIATGFIFALCCSFELDYDQETSTVMMWVTIGTVFSIMFFNYIDIIIWQYIAIKEICQRWQKRRMENKIQDIKSKQAELNLTTEAAEDKYSVTNDKTVATKASSPSPNRVIMPPERASKTRRNALKPGRLAQLTYLRPKPEFMLRKKNRPSNKIIPDQ